MDQAIALVKPGATTADIVVGLAAAQEFGFPDEKAAFALQYGHGVGLSIWEKPIFSRLVSLDHPESRWKRAWSSRWRPTGRPATAGRPPGSRRKLVVTADGCEVITKFPAEELLVAGHRYYTVGGPLDTLRDSQSHKNTAAGRGELAGSNGAGSTTGTAANGGG